MGTTIFLWSPRNEEHIDKHDVAPEGGIRCGSRGVPVSRECGDAKRSVWGKTRAGRYLQVIFVDVFIDDVKPMYER